MVASAKDAQEPTPAQSQDVGAPETAPDGLEFAKSLDRGIASAISGANGSHARSNNKVCSHSMLQERTHHSHLNSANVASTSQYEGCF
jgi:hypothetical protein